MIKFFVLCSLLIFSTISSAQDEDSDLTSSMKKRTTLGLQLISWTEPLRVQQGTSVSADNANFSGTALTVEQDYTNGRYGFGPIAAIIFGRANAGGTNSLNYSSGKLGWNGALLGLRGIYRITKQLAIGIQLPIVYRTANWPTINSVEATSGKTLNYSLLFELRARINKDWELNQAIGPFSSDGGSMWRLGMSKTW